MFRSVSYRTLLHQTLFIKYFYARRAFYIAPDIIDYTIKINYSPFPKWRQPRQNAAVIRFLSIYLSISILLSPVSRRCPRGDARLLSYLSDLFALTGLRHIFDILNIFLILHHISQHMALIFNVSGYADLVKYVLEMRLYCVFGKVHLVCDH